MRTICAVIGLDPGEASRVRPLAMAFFEASSDSSLFGPAEEALPYWSKSSPTPDEVTRLDRSPNPHMALGYGIHTCVGAQLARLELQVATSELLRRIPDIEADGEAPHYRFSGGNLAVLSELPAWFPTPSAC